MTTEDELFSSITIVDDDPFTLCLLKDVAEELGFSVTTYGDACGFLGSKREDPVLIMLDLVMPGMDGIEVLRKLAEQFCRSQIILMSGYDSGVLHSARKLAEQRHLNVVASFTKPISIAELQQVLLSAKQQLLVARAGPETDDLPTAEELDTALLEGQLELYCQPQIDLRTGQVHGAEALLRWFHPERGMIPPASFIPSAEQENRMGNVTGFVIKSAASMLKQWRSEGINLPLSVNVSADNITSLGLPEQLSKLVTSHSIDPSLLVIEITESSLMTELVTSLDILTRLRMKGFSLSIDDFGTGFSSLVQLHRAPFTELKIDQSFVSNMLEDEEARAIVEICTILGHKINMTVVAEGIEDQETLEMLQQIGCDIIQGYHVARPMPAQDYGKWLRQYKPIPTIAANPAASWQRPGGADANSIPESRG